jgi:hypothetical protein
MSETITVANTGREANGKITTMTQQISPLPGHISMFLGSWIQNLMFENPNLSIERTSQKWNNDIIYTARVGRKFIGSLAFIDPPIPVLV